MVLVNLGCNQQEKYVPMVQLEENYSCEQHVIDSDAYSFNVQHIFKLRVIDYTNKQFDIHELERDINREFVDTNMSFNIVEYQQQVVPSDSVTIDIYKKFDEHFKIGTITMIVVSDSVRFLKGDKEGSANGIPELDNVSLGKPIFFVKRHATYKKNIGIIAHEIGHVFGLKHLFEGYDLYDKGLNCNHGDQIPDVVTLPRLGSVSPRTCAYYAPDEYIKDYTKQEVDEAVINYMSYSPPNCLQKFSDAQIEKMRKMVEVNPLIQYAKVRRPI